MPLYLGNIAAEVKQDQLEAEFSKFGKCEIHFYGKFAFIEYSNAVAAKNAFLHWNGKELCGQPLKIELTDAPLLRKGPTQNTSGNTEKSIQKPNLTPCKVPVKNDYPEVNLNWDYSDNEEFLDSPSEGLTPLKSKLRPCPIPRNKRGRKKIGEPAISPVIFIDHNTIAAYGNVFKLKRISKNDGNSIIKCEICNRKFKMKSVRSHVISKLHQDKFS